MCPLAVPHSPGIGVAGPLIAVHDGLVPPPNPVQVQVFVELQVADKVCAEGAVPAEHNSMPPKVTCKPSHVYV